MGGRHRDVSPLACHDSARLSNSAVLLGLPLSFFCRVRDLLAPVLLFGVSHLSFRGF